MLGVGLELRVSQECEVCFQEILPKRQLPLNSLLIYGHGMCPSCRQLVTEDIERDQEYRKRYRQFIKGLKLDL